MTRFNFFILVALIISFIGSTPTLASNCGIKFQHSYEEGVRDGRIDGSHRQDSDPARHRSHLYKDLDKGSERAECYVEGYDIGYGNAYEDASYSEPSYDDAPKYGTNERAYYDDGCRDGTGDAQMNMSMAYERHSDMYDSRFEPYFRQGYEACWQQYR